MTFDINGKYLRGYIKVIEEINVPVSEVPLYMPINTASIRHYYAYPSRVYTVDGNTVIPRIPLTILGVKGHLVGIREGNTAMNCRDLYSLIADRTNKMSEEIYPLVKNTKYHEFVRKVMNVKHRCWNKDLPLKNYYKKEFGDQWRDRFGVFLVFEYDTEEIQTILNSV